MRAICVTSVIIKTIHEKANNHAKYLTQIRLLQLSESVPQRVSVHKVGSRYTRQPLSGYETANMSRLFRTDDQHGTLFQAAQTNQCAAVGKSATAPAKRSYL
jgi:hypothetical protein